MGFKQRMLLLSIKWRRLKIRWWLYRNKIPYRTRLFLPGVRARLEHQIVVWIRVCQEIDLLDRSFPLVWNNRHIVMYELVKEEGIHQSIAESYGHFTVIGVYRFGKRPLYVDRRHDG